VSKSTNDGVTRRELMSTTGKIAVASALAGVAIPAVHAGENNTIQVALVGCGGRGTGAAGDAMSAKNGPVKLVAMADVFPQRLSDSYKSLKDGFGSKVDVPDKNKFIGFDAYKKAMDCLRKGDIVILTTPPAFRWVHFTHAIEKGINVFMEKPITVDGPSTRRMLKLEQEAKKKNLKVGVGLMCRHCDARHELYKRIKDGQIGDIVLLRAYRMHGPVGWAFSLPKPSNGITELLYQVQRFHSFLWASGGLYSDFYIHNIDECCWMKDAWPVQAQALGGRQYRGNFIDQNFDNYAVEYTFADGAKLLLDGRTMDSSTRSPTGPSYCSMGGRWTAATRNLPATPTAPGGRRSSPPVPTRRRTAASTRTRRSSTRAGRWATRPGGVRPGSRTPTSSSGTTCSTPSARTSRTTRSSAARKPAW
jgi:predicted dehydrogenase